MELSSGGDPRQILRAAFGPAGALSRAIPGYEERQEQVDMALGVWDALSGGSHLLVEAGTGVGKSMAYILPALLWIHETKSRVVISTHTVNLQAQLARKDIPAALDLWSGDCFRPKHASFKGRSHYLCIRKWRQAAEELLGKTALFKLTEEELALERLGEQIASGEWDGDRETLAFPVSGSTWQEVCSEGDRCMASQCPERQRCFYHNHRRNLDSCHLIVVNHALFAAHLAIFSETGGLKGLLPGFGAVVFDEAHHLEDVMRDSLGKEVSQARLKRLCDDTTRLASRGAVKKSISPDALKSLRRELDTRMSELDRILRTLPSGGKEKRRLLDAGTIDQQFIKSLGELGKELAQWEEFDLSDEERFEVSAIRRRFGTLVSDLQDVSDLLGSGESYVYWSEPPGTARRSPVVVRRAPLEVGPYLQEMLWSTVPSGILTSATLATNSTFEYQRSMLGLLDATEMIFGSPFDYRARATLCVPREGRRYDPNSQMWNSYLERKILEIVDIASGRTLVLFTNRASMDKVATLVRDRIEEKGYPFLKQGDDTRESLLHRFAEAGCAVLFGLDSFWEGIDVPGDALSCVAIAKLPFPVPDDPVLEAREQIWIGKGLSPFTYYSLPVATLKLKQGFGRLIRKKSDRGAVVILDPRIATKNYGRAMLASLPPAKLTYDLDDIGHALPRPSR